MAFTSEQLTTMRSTLELPETADEAAITAAVEAVVAENLEEREPTAETTTPAIPEGMVLVDSEVLTELRSGAEAGRTARRELDDQARDRAIDAAIQAGKTTPARRDHWVASWKADAEGTQALLDSLEPGLAVPTAELGQGGQPENTEDEAIWSALFADETQEA